MKKVNFGYSVLVIILFAALCFSTVYICVNRKVGYDCAVKTTVVESNTKIYKNADVAGVYEVVEKASVPSLPNIEEITYRLILGTDGTYRYDSIIIAGYEAGNYYIEDNKIILNSLFKGGSDVSVRPINEKNVVEISDNAMIDNSPLYTDYIGKSSITLVKVSGLTDDNNQPLANLLDSVTLDNNAR